MRRLKKTAIFAILAAALVLTVAFLALQTPAYATLNSTSIPVSPAKPVWEKSFGGTGDDRAFFCLDVADGILIVGSTASVIANRTVGWALKINYDGEEMWNQTFLDGQSTELRYALKITDGFLLIGNQFTASEDVNGYIAKVDSQGKLIWQRVIGTQRIDKLFSAISTGDSFVTFGLTQSAVNGISSAWVTKLDGDGNVVWNRTYSDLADTAIRSGVLTQDGSLMAAGYTNPQGKGNYDFYLLKISQDGNLLWNKTYGGSDSERACTLKSASDGYVLAGDINSATSATDAWVLKVNLEGNPVWNTTIGGIDVDSLTDIVPSKDGSYLLTGFTFSYGAGQRDFWLTKLGSNGQVMWSRTIGNQAYQEAYGVVEVGENQYVLVGWTDPFGHQELIGEAQYDFYVVKLSAP